MPITLTHTLAPTPLLRSGAAALLVGGPLSLVFHALWRIGHGPTVVNEHGVVLGLTNDQWSYLSGAWMALVAVGVVAVCSLHRGRLRVVAGTLTVLGLVLSAAASWVWPLYSVGLLMQYTGTVCLAVLVLRGRVLPRVSGYALLLAAVTFLPMTFATEAVIAASDVLPGMVLGWDLIAGCAAAGWTLLGYALFAASRRPTGVSGRQRRAEVLTRAEIRR
jgi:hypothetical protein